MRFTKMHGAGNDYIYVNCFEEKVENPGELAVRLSDRNFSIGGDGLVLIKPSDKADFRMDMYNADGSRSQMCGNAVRCVAKYVYDHCMTDKTTITVDTLSGVKIIDIAYEYGRFTASVNMGEPVLNPKEIPVNLPGDTLVSVPVTINGGEYNVTCVSMGNPHCVMFIDNVDHLNIADIGPAFENADIFPERVNTEFVEVIDDKTLKMRVWERGSGETLACGTGTCAAVVAAVLNGACKREDEITVHLRGGDLKILWHKAGYVRMTGSAETVFKGEICL